MKLEELIISKRGRVQHSLIKIIAGRIEIDQKINDQVIPPLIEAYVAPETPP